MHLGLTHVWDTMDCAPLVADLLLFFYERDFMMSLSDDKQANVIDVFQTTSRYLDDILNINNVHFHKRDDFDFEIINLQLLDGGVPCSSSYGVYISQPIRFASASSHVADFNTGNKLLTQKLLKQGYRYHKLHKTFSKFY